MMTYDELKEYLHCNEAETQTFLPNEIFEELKVIENVQHRAFAYAYIYLTTYLWRYAKYGEMQYKDLTQEKLKEILGRKGDERLNYLIKKDGVLEQLNWLETTNNPPILYEWESDEQFLAVKKEISDWRGEVYFTLAHDWEDSAFYEDVKPPNKFTAKRPIRGTHRYPNDPEWVEEYDDGYEDGTFGYVDNTHRVPIEVFLYCMTKKEVGIKGFYMYAYIYSKNQLFGGFDATFSNLSAQLAIPEKTIERYLDIVRKFNMVIGLHNQDFFVVGMKKEQRKANTYITNDIDLFSDEPIQYKKIKVLKRQEYLKMLEDEKKKKEEEDIEKYGITLTLDQLPY
ncbi:hypothetical protein H7S74_30320 [Priestia aryabhattai]|uniref:hypothetical protein n=1 Tax=Priestia aryabhattai TaxID=412384 RepID=UPI001EC6D0D5|nr:hypothetical protein [Priestia aryabhattai]MBY0094921.1 hypothetical protein [Priestia aryabhattai]MBY0105591.1 hypothetical protein [Priestia aryabhattai]